VSLPNLISLARLLAAPLAVWLILSGHFAAAFWLFIAAAASDAVDGFIAKRFGKSSVLGGYLDPLADKALLLGTYISIGHVSHLPLWLVILVVSRDILIVGGALLILMLSDRLRMQPMVISKINTAAQILLAGLVLAGLGLGFDVHRPVAVLTWAVAATTLISGAGYVIEWSRRMPEEEGRAP
jgi:cardiolipin synthase